jgi:inosose dehydratase
MELTLNRRNFLKSIAIGLSAASVPALRAAGPRKLKIGYTCITWGAFPRGAEASATLEAALKDISSLGFYGFETFPEILEDWDARDALSQLINQYGVPLTSAYIRTNLTDLSVRKDDLAQTIRLAKIIKKYGGTFGVLAPNSVKRDGYDFQAHRANIISGLNDAAKAVADVGLGAGLHQHTGTCIETREEVYAVMEAVNTKYVKFAPDVGQLQKGGADAAKVVKDFLPLVRHMHLKDFSGGEHFAGYCPLGQGKVDIAGILDMVEGANPPANVMVELDPSKDQPMSALETARISKAYLQKLGYKFRS